MTASRYATGPASEAEFTKIQELIYELKIDQIMTRSLITISPDSPMGEAKELMRFHRISGLPVTQDRKLAGVVSVEDIIRWLEHGAPRATVQEWMTKNLYTVRGDQAAVQAITMFGRHKVGRLPVVDRQGALVGIVTPGDIIGRVLRVLDGLYREAEARRGPAARCTLSDLVSDGTIMVLRYQVAARDFDRAGMAATKIKRVLEGIGISPQLVRRAGIAAYEAEINLVIHTERGGVLQLEIGPRRLEIEARDDGPGIEDPDLAVQQGFSTAPDWIRELGFGAGMGLHNMKTCADCFSLESWMGRGTTVRVSIDLPGGREGSSSR